MFVENYFILKSKTGEEVQVRAAIGVSKEKSVNQFSCEVFLDGYLNNLAPIQGVSSFQSLSLAISLSNNYCWNLKIKGVSSSKKLETTLLM